MKKILTLIITFMAGIAAAAQTIAPDPAFRVGRLDNGMTYYLYHNENPAGCAEFYIAHNVGALQEEDNQNGLAHFLEHMAFNGTKHYPEKGLLEFLAKEGVRFGYNVNAYTSRTETVYNISVVPLVRESFVDSVLTVLHDWSCDISCEQKALDDERGVISEEWRLRDDSRYRMMVLQNNLIYRGSKQTERSVLGTLEVINGFKREEILDFYHKWYRPDMQAIIIVGDFDVDQMEARVRAKFSDIPMPSDAPQKEYYFPPKQDGPIFEDMTDSRIKFNALKIIYKQPYPGREERATEECIKDYYCRSIITAAIGERLRRACQRPETPARSAVLVTSEYEPDFYISMFTVTPKSKDLLGKSLAFTHTAIRRALLYGISRQEFEVAKLSASQRFHLDRPMDPEEVKSSDVVKSALGHFLKNHPLVGPVELQDIQSRIMSEISYEDILPYPAKMFAESEVIYSNCYNDVEEPGIAPTPEKMKEIIARVDAQEIVPAYVNYPAADLSVDVPQGSIKSIRQKNGIETWTLSNGVKVFYKKAEPLKSNYHLSMSYRFDTGYRSYPEDRVTASRFAASYATRTVGFRGLEKTDFKNYPELSGFSVLFHPTQRSSNIEVSAGKGKEENAFKSVYLMLSEPFFGREPQLARAKEDNLKSLARTKRPRAIYDENCVKTVYGDHPWLQVMDSTAIQAVDLDFVKEVFNRAYGDFGHMTLFICSDLDRALIEDYVKRYVATLSGEWAYTKSKTAFPSPVIKGYTLLEETNKPESEPVSTVYYAFIKKIKPATKALVCSSFLDYILSARYNSLIREERGGTYHVGFATEVEDNPDIPWRGVVEFQTRPEMTEVLLQDVKTVMDDICANGPTVQEMEVAAKYLAKRRGEVEHRVSMSVGMQRDRLINTVLWGRDYEYDYKSVIAGIKADDVRKLAKKLSSGSTLVEVYTEK